MRQLLERCGFDPDGGSDAARDYYAGISAAGCCAEARDLAADCVRLLNAVQSLEYMGRALELLHELQQATPVSCTVALVPNLDYRGPVWDLVVLRPLVNAADYESSVMARSQSVLEAVELGRDVLRRNHG